MFEKSYFLLIPMNFVAYEAAWVSTGFELWVCAQQCPELG